MIRHGDGYLVITRGYDDAARIHKVSSDFKMIKQTNLTETYDFMKKYISRPSIFEADGGHYLIGRNYTKTHPTTLSEWPMELCFYRIDPDSFEIISYSVLDNAERRLVGDGYYATPYWQERGGTLYFNAITYRGIGCHHPDNKHLPVDPTSLISCDSSLSGMISDRPKRFVRALSGSAFVQSTGSAEPHPMVRFPQDGMKNLERL